MAEYRGRFAPSPTGPLHRGSLVAALASYLDARAHGGEWLVRIEDIDGPRNVPGAADAILRLLAACALAWDGKVVYQTTRFPAYAEALQRLKNSGAAYPCGCTRKEIGDGVYPGTCRAGLPAARAARSWRLRTDGDDFVLFRADGIWAYQLAVVVDDAWQGITHVVRGADLLDSTPRQVALQQALGLPPVSYMHVPVVLGDGGQKLSKQTKAPPVDPANPGPALAGALRFLGLPVPVGLDALPPRDIVAWGIAHWP